MKPKTKLSRREASVYAFIFTSLSSVEIGITLGISEHAAQVTVTRVCQRFGVNGRVALMAAEIERLRGAAANSGVAA